MGLARIAQPMPGLQSLALPATLRSLRGAVWRSRAALLALCRALDSSHFRGSNLRPSGPLFRVHPTPAAAGRLLGRHIL